MTDRPDRNGPPCQRCGRPRPFPTVEHPDYQSVCWACGEQLGADHWSQLRAERFGAIDGRAR